MKIDYFPKQVEFWNAVRSPEYMYLLYGGAIRGGKTYVGLGIIFVLCKIFPGSRWAIVRKDLPTLRRNTLPVFDKIAPRPFVGPVNKTTWESECENGSRIIFFPESIKDDPELNRFKGLEVNGFLFEEINECQNATFWKAIERAGTWEVHVNGKKAKHQPPPKIMATCNPAQNWVKTLFHDPWKSGSLKPPYFYLPATAEDNPHVPEATRKSWENLPENEYRRFVLGDWDYADEPDQLVKYEWILHCQNEVEHIPGANKMGVDVARYGDDETVFALVEGNCLCGGYEYSGLSTDAVADRTKELILTKPVSAENVNVDGVGLGAGVVDLLRRWDLNVKEFIAGASPTGVDSESDIGLRYKNLRSQVYWEFREKIRKGEVKIDWMPDKLLQELTAIKYVVEDKMIKVESKKEIKKRIGRSTDYADAVVMAFYEEQNSFDIMIDVTLEEDDDDY